MSGVDIQDLTPVVIGSKAKRGSNTSKVPGETKASGVVGIGGKLESGTARKLDNNEAKAPEAVGKEAIMTARGEKWDQKALADSLNLSKTVIAQLEQGVYKKDNRLLQRLEKKLGVWLTGDPDRIGTAKAEKEKKKAAQEKTAMADDKVKAAKKEDADSKITVDEDIPVIDDAPAADTETRELPEEK